MDGDGQPWITSDGLVPDYGPRGSVERKLCLRLRQGWLHIYWFTSQRESSSKLEYLQQHQSLHFFTHFAKIRQGSVLQAET